MTPEEQLKEDQWNVRIDRLENKIDRLENKMVAGFNAVDAKFNAVDAKFNNQRHLMIGMILAVIGQIVTALLLHKWN
jgi:hypothetical protein